MSELWSANRGFMSSETLSEELRYALQPMIRFRQFCDVEVALGKNVGRKLPCFDLPSNLAALPFTGFRFSVFHESPLKIGSLKRNASISIDQVFSLGHDFEREIRE